MDFRVLGPLEVESAGEVLVLGGTKQRAVLAHLLLRAGTQVSAERLIDDVWDDDPPAAARNVLQSYVSRLRKLVGADRLEQRSGGYLLHAGVDEVDLQRFERLLAQARQEAVLDPEAAVLTYRAADALWRAPALADLADQPALRAEAARMDEHGLAAREERLALELGLGRHAELVPELERLAGQHPYREGLWGRLMTALYRSGRQADALEAYRRVRTLLLDELGLEPSDELRRLEDQVLRQDPELAVAGRPLRGFRLLEEIGRGASGVVHRALQGHIGREVAVKVIDPALADDPTFIGRFEAEAQLVARLEHPHIVPLYDYWREPGGAFLVMRLLRGGSLAQLLASGPLPVERALGVVEQVAGALAHAHRQGVVHRDVRPGNVLLDEDGNAYLSDFGIARRTGCAVDLPAGFVAPEERRGEELTPRADVYSLGLVLFEMLAGSDAGPALEHVVRRATLDDPAQRYPDATALLTAVATAVGTAARAVAAADGPARNPFKGLRPFDEPDAIDFHGREGLVQRLLERFGSGERLLALVGPSGSGKSSLVRAGLVPVLRARDGWRVAVLTPGADPFRELAGALSGVAPVALPRGGGLRDAVEALLPHRDGELVLVLDQFEELWTRGLDEEVRERFLAELAAAVTVEGSRVRVVLTLRADHLDGPLALPDFAPVLAAGVEHVLPMTADELQRAVSAPAAAVGVRVEPGLVAELVSEVRGQAAALPVLQFALAELFDRRVAAELSLNAHRALGGLAGAVARAAEELYAGIDDNGRECVRQVFLRLVDVDGTGQAARRPAPLSELRDVNPGADDVVGRFVRRRLLTLDRDPTTREPTVEVAHDALLTSWARLEGWLAEAVDGLREQRRLAIAARDWRDAGRDPSFLLVGGRLAAAEAAARDSSVALAADERELLSASAAARDASTAEDAVRVRRERELERRSVRRLRSLVAALASAAVIAAGLTLVAFDQRGAARDERQVAQARGLAAAADASIGTDGERSVLLALEAVRQAPAGPARDEAVEALHRAVVGVRVQSRVPGVGGALDWSADGALFVTEGEEESGRVEVHDAVTGKSMWSLRGHDADVNLGVFSPDSRTLATSSDDGSIRLWDARTGRALQTLSLNRPGSQVWGLAFSADGTRVAGAWLPDSVGIFEVRSGRQVREFDVPELRLGASFTPDGKRLAVAAAGGARVIDVATGRTAFTVDEGLEVTDADLSPDGRWLATTSYEGSVRVWHARDGRFAHELSGHSGEVVMADWSTDSRRLVTAAGDGTARVWAIGDRSVREAVVLTAEERGGGLWAAFSPDGQRVMTGDGEVTSVLVWDASEHASPEWVNVPAAAPLPSDVVVTSDGARLVVPEEGGLGVWDATTGRRLGGLPGRPSGAPVHFDVSPQGVVALVDGKRVRAWQLDGRAVFDVSLDLQDNAEEVAWDRSGERLAVASPGRVHLLDRRGAVLDTLVDPAGLAAWAVRFSPDGRTLVVNAREVDRPRPDADRVVVWDIERGEIRRRLTVAADGLAISPDGRQVAAATPDGAARVFDIASGDEVARLPGHAGRITMVAFSPDGRQLATGSTDATVRLWDWRGRRQVLLLRGHEDAVWSVGFTADGSRLVSLGRDGHARVWALDEDDLVSIARRKVTRSLTDAECRQYLGSTCGTA